jgi:hypothetical protein
MNGRESLLEKWRRFRSLPPGDRRLILRAALLLSFTEAGLRCFGFLRWKEFIEKFSLPANLLQSVSGDERYGKSLRASRAVRSAELHLPLSPNCVERSMALWWLLRIEGIEAEMHIGARKEDGHLQAHAWVELHGRVLNDGAEVHQHYAVFDAPIAGLAQPRVVDRPSH